MGSRSDDDAENPGEGTRPGDSGRAPDPDPPAEAGFDERWASLVEQLRDLDDDAGPPGPERPRVVRPARTEPAQAEPRELSGRDWDGSEQIDAADRAVDDQEHFVPPDPGPVFGGDPMLTMAWLVVVAAPLFGLLALVAWHDAPRILVQGSGVAFLAAIGVLIWRMPHRRDGNDDDGAVV